MPVGLADPIKLDELSRIVEGKEMVPSLEEFIQSLGLPVEEEDSVIRSLEILPNLHVGPEALPRVAPDLVRMAWWH